MARLDDLTGILVPPPDGPIRFGQGTILSWNASTFENTIDWRGVTLTDVPVVSGTEALSYQAGDVVALLGWAPSQGSAGSWWILGRVVIPGTDKGAEAINWMTTSLGRAVALAVLGEAINVDLVADLVSIGDQSGGTSWIDLPDSPGPEVSGVTIGETGRALVVVSAWINTDVDPSILTTEGVMSYEISGATTQAAGALDRRLSHRHGVDAAGSFARSSQDSSLVSIATGLIGGVHTFTAKYTAFVGAAGQEASFRDRSLIVIPF